MRISATYILGKRLRNLRSQKILRRSERSKKLLKLLEEAPEGVFSYITEAFSKLKCPSGLIFKLKNYSYRDSEKRKGGNGK